MITGFVGEWRVRQNLTTAEIFLLDSLDG